MNGKDRKVNFANMDFTSPFQFGFIQTTPIELVAVFFGLLSVWFMKKESTLAFPFGIINVLIYIYIFFQTHLYANAGINAFFFLMSVYGWYNWTRKGKDEKNIRITECSGGVYLLYVMAILGFFIVLWFLLKRVTDSQVPQWDALTTAIYIIGMWLLARKKIENWLLWIIADSMMIVLCAYEHLYFTSLQYLIFTIIAVLGFLEWRIKLMK